MNQPIQLVVILDIPFATSAEAHSDLGHDGIRAAVTNRQTAMIAREGREVTRAEAESSLGHDGIRAAVTNRQTAMIAQGREATLAEAHSDLTSTGGNRRVATQNEYSNRLERFPMTLSDAGRIGGNVRAIDDDRGLCETPDCRNWQVASNKGLCHACVTKKSKRKREIHEELGARICAGCGDEVASDRKMRNGCCDRCYARKYRKTGRVIDPAKKLCTHVSGCDNMRHMGGLCQRHHRNRHLDASSTSECAAGASAATAPKERRSTKARNGKKKAKKKKPVVVKKDAKTEGLAADYEDREADSDYDDDNDDEDEWDEEH